MTTINSWLKRYLTLSCALVLAFTSNIEAIALQTTVPAATDTWSQWRGADRDGILKNQPVWPATLSTKNLVERWKIPLGPSYSGPLVVGDWVFVTETVDKKDEWVRCLNRKTGEQIWQANWTGSMKVPFFAASNGSWIRSTPAVANGKLFVGGIRDVLVCLDAANGTELWRRDFPAEMQTPPPQFGCVCSPLTDGDFVYMQAGGAMHKLNQSDGKTVWQSAKDKPGENSSVFSSPAIGTVGGKRQLLVQGRNDLMGIALDSGSVLWKKTVPSFRGMSILTPTVFNDQFFISNYQFPSTMLSVKESGGVWSVSESWKLKARGYMTSPVVIDGHAYTFLQNQRFACIDLESGAQKWVSQSFAKYASLIANGDQILALTSDGELVLYKANSERFELIDRRAVGTNAWAHLAVSGDAIFVRNIDGLTAFQWQQ